MDRFSSDTPAVRDNGQGGHPLRAVMTGVAGNRWYDRLEPPFHSRGTVRDVIYRRKRRYRRALQSGYALMQTKRFAATEVPFFVTCCSGFDARDLLPPFPPDLRPDDTVFMWFLRKFDRHGLIGHLPVMVRHDLGPRRPDRYRPPGDAEISLTEIVTGIVADVVNSSLPNHGAPGLIETGHRIREIAGLSLPDWIEFVHTIWVRSRGGTAAGSLERLLEQYNESPDYWAQRHLFVGAGVKLLLDIVREFAKAICMRVNGSLKGTDLNFVIVARINDQYIRIAD